MPTDADLPLPGLSAAALRRARLQAELAGLDSVRATRAVTHARRRHQQSESDAIAFWHALYVELAPLPTPSPDNAAHDHHGTAEALMALGSESRTALLLRVGERLPIKGIGQVLDEPADRVQRHLAQAMRQLRARLGDSNQRDDAHWLGTLERWLQQSTSLAGDPTPSARREPPSLGAPAKLAVNPMPKRSSSRARKSRVPLWLGLALVLAVIGAARMGADRWLDLRSPAPSVAVDPLVDWLLLPAEDAELVESIDSPETVAELDFLLWLQQHNPEQSKQERTDADQ